MPIPGAKLPLTPEDAQRLGDFIGSTTIDLQAEHDPIVNKQVHWWKTYEGKPRTERRTFPWDGAPLSRDTEVLAKQGWTRVDELRIGDVVLTRHDRNGRLGWQPVLATPSVWADYLLHFKSKSVDQLVTSEHQMVVENQKGEVCRLPASKLWDTTGLRIPLTGWYEGEKPAELFGLPAGDVMELIGWYLAEGWCNKQQGRPVGSVFLSQSQTANPKKCERIERLLARLGISWARHRLPSVGYTLRVRSMPDELAKLLREQGRQEARFIPSWVFDLDPSLLWRMIDGLFFGDGSVIDRPDRNFDSFPYTTISKKLADGIQIVAALIGMRSVVKVRAGHGGNFGPARHVQYSLCLLHKKRAKVDAAKHQLTPYGDYAFCVTVKNHAICVRRNGIPSWTGNSNVVLPLAKTWGSAIIARHSGRLFASPDFWSGSTQNEKMREVVDAWIPYQNWAARGNVFEMFMPTADVLGELVAMGSGFYALSWSEQVALRYTPASVRDSKKVGPPVKMFSHRGPLLEHVPRADLLWIPGRSTMDSEIVVRRKLMTRAELIAFGREAGLDEAVLDKMLQSPDEQGSDESSKRAGFAGSIKMYDIRQAWVDYPLIQSGKLEAIIPLDEASTERPPVPIVVTFQMGTKLVANAITHPYFFSHKPFYDAHFDKRAGRADSQGVAEMADHIQRGATTMMNQAIDAVTLANSVNFVTTDRRLIDFKFSPSRPILVDNIQSVLFPTLSKQIVPDLALINALIATGERLFSVGDPALGRETRLGGHPSPATSTLAMLDQLAINVAVSLRYLRQRLSKVGEDVATLFQQFEADVEDGRVEAAVGYRDAAIIKQLVLPLDQPISGNMRFDVNALSEAASPEHERSKVVLEDQMLTNYYSQLLGAAQILQTPVGQSPMVREIVMLAIKGKTETMKRFLATTNFDNVEDVILQLGQSRGASQQLLEQALGALQQRGAGPGATTLPLAGMGLGTNGAPGADGDATGNAGAAPFGAGG